MAEIGQPVREIEVVPASEPVPGELPVEAPVPSRPDPDREPVPA